MGALGEDLGVLEVARPSNGKHGLAADRPSLPDSAGGCSLRAVGHQAYPMLFITTLAVGTLLLGGYYGGTRGNCEVAGYFPPAVTSSIRPHPMMQPYCFHEGSCFENPLAAAAPFACRVVSPPSLGRWQGPRAHSTAMAPTPLGRLPLRRPSAVASRTTMPSQPRLLPDGCGAQLAVSGAANLNPTSGERFRY